MSHTANGPNLCKAHLSTVIQVSWNLSDLERYFSLVKSSKNSGCHKSLILFLVYDSVISLKLFSISFTKPVNVQLSNAAVLFLFFCVDEAPTPLSDMIVDS